MHLGCSSVYSGMNLSAMEIAPLIPLPSLKRLWQVLHSPCSLFLSVFFPLSSLPVISLIEQFSSESTGFGRQVSGYVSIVTGDMRLIEGRGVRAQREEELAHKAGVVGNIVQVLLG